MDRLISAILQFALAMGTLATALAAVATFGNRLMDFYMEEAI